MALRSAYVDPSDHARELHSFVRVLDHKRTLVLFHDDYYQYELLPVPTTSPPLGSPLWPKPRSRLKKPWQYGSPIDFDSVDAGVLDEFDYVITVRTAYQSEPPPNFRLASTYTVRTSSGDGSGRRFLVACFRKQELPAPFSTVANVGVGDIARAHGAAHVRARPIVQTLNWALGPGRSSSDNDHPAAWQLGALTPLHESLYCPGCGRVAANDLAGEPGQARCVLAHR